MSYSFGSFRRWFQRRRQSSIKNNRPNEPRRGRSQLQLEHLEDRAAPAVSILGTPASLVEESGTQFAATITNFSVDAGSDRVLIVSTAGGGGNADVVSVTFGGTALTQAAEQDTTVGAGVNTAEIWYLPLGTGAATTGNVVVTYSANFNFVVSAAAFQGVDQTTPATGTGNQAASLTVTSSADDMVLDAIATTNTGTVLVVGGGQTQLVNADDLGLGNQPDAAASTEPGAATVDMSWTDAGTQIAHAAVNINAASVVADTTTALTSSSNPSVFGETVTFTATVTAVAPSTDTPSGTVTFVNVTDSVTLGTVSLDAAGQASLSLSSLGVGSYTINATFNANASFNGSSDTLTQTVNSASTTTALASNVNPSVFGQPVTFTATVTALAPSTAIPTGTVTFVNITDNVTLGTVNLDASGRASVSLSSLGVGSYQISATFNANASFNSSSDSLTQTVNQASTTTTITSDNPDPSSIGQPITVTFTVAAAPPGAGTPTGDVTISDGVDSVTVPVAGGSASLVLTTPGTRTLTATYNGDGNFLTSSDTASHEVLNAVFITGGGGDDTVIITATGVNSGAYTVNGGPAVPFDGILGFRFDGAGGNDLLQINNPAAGLFAPVNGVFFDGGTQTGAPGDRLEILGGAHTSETHNFAAAGVNGNNGSLELVQGGAAATINYTGLEPILVNAGTPDDIVFNLPTGDGNNNAALGDDGLANGLSQISGSGFETTAFANPANSLTVNTGNDGETVTLTDLDTGYAASTNVNGGGAADTFNVQATVAGTLTTVSGSGADDIFNVGSLADSLDGIAGLLSLIGGAHTTGDAVNLRDQGDGDVNTYVLSGTALSRNGGLVLNMNGIETASLDADNNVSGSTGNTIDVTPSTTTALNVNGNAPTFPASPGDTLGIGLAGTTGATLTLTGAGAGTWTFASAHQPVSYTGIENVDAAGGAYNLVIDMNAPGLNTNGAAADTIDARLDATGSQLEIRVNGVVVFNGAAADINSLEVLGSADDDTFTITETAGGLPSFAGAAPGGHTNAAFTASGLAPTNVGIHFEGGAGTNSGQLSFLTSQNVAYFADAVQANSGVISVASAFTLSFDAFAPWVYVGAGGNLLLDASALPVVTTLDINDDLADTAGAGGNVVTGNGGFETAFFAGFDSVTVRGGDGAEAITVFALDPASSETAITLDGDNITNTDAGNDTINIRTLPATVSATMLGGAGDDDFLIGGFTGRADLVLGQVTVSPAGDEAGDDELLITDTQRPVGSTVLVTSTVINGLTGASLPQVTYNAGDLIETIRLVGSDSDGDTFNIQSTMLGSTYQVDLGLGAFNDVANISSDAPANAGTLDDIDGQVNLSFGAGNDTLNVSDLGDGAGDTYTLSLVAGVTQLSFGDGAEAVDIRYNVDFGFGAGALEFFTLTGSNTGANVYNVNATTALTSNIVRDGDAANTGNAIFNIQMDALASGDVDGSINTFTGNGGNDNFNLNFAADSSINAGADMTLQINGNDPAADSDNRDVVNIDASADTIARTLGFTYADPASGDVDVTGLGLPAGGFIDINTVETLNYTGGGAPDTATVTGTAVDDLLTVAPTGANSALVFIGGDPFDGPPEDFFSNRPGVAEGSVGPDMNLQGLDTTSGLTVNGGGGTNNTLFVYGQSEDDLLDDSGNVVIPGAGVGNAYDEILGTDSAVRFVDDVDAFLPTHVLVTVNIDTASFDDADPLDDDLVVNAGYEASPGPGGIADDIVAVLPGSTTFGIQINGGDPDPSNAPNGDRLRVFTPAEINVFSDKATPPNVTVTSGGSGQLGFSSIERILLEPGNGVVNLVGDNNDPAVDQPDNFVVRGADVDGDPSDGGVGEFNLFINGSSAIGFDSVQFLNVLGDDLALTPSAGNDIDTLDIAAYADNTPRGWGIQVTFDEGNPVQADGDQADLLIYNTVAANPVSENIVVQPSGPEAGELRVTNAAFGTPIVTISYINNLDIIVNDNDGVASDTDSLTLRGTNPDNPGASGLDEFVIDLTAAGTVAEPLVTVADANAGALLYRVRDFTGFDTLSIESLGGSDVISVIGRDDGSVTVNVDGGDPTGTGAGVDTVVLQGTAGADAFLILPGASSDSGRAEATRSSATAATVVNFTHTEVVQVDGAGGGDVLTVEGTGGDDAITVTGLGNQAAVVTSFGPNIVFENFGTTGSALNLNGRAGEDSLVIQQLGAWQLQSVAVTGGSAGDSVQITGSGGDDAFTYTATGTNSGQLGLLSGGLTTNYGLGSVETLAIDGLAQAVADTLDVTTANAVITPGAAPGSGLIAPVDGSGNPLLPLAYAGIESVAVSGGSVVIEGTDANDTINVSAAGIVSIINELGFANSVDLSGVNALVINARGGDDSITIEPSTLFAGGITVIGGDNGTGSDSVSVADNNPAIDFATGQITNVVGGPISLDGVEIVNLTGAALGDFIVTNYGAPTGVQTLNLIANGTDDVDISATAGPDTIRFEPLSSTSARVTRAEGGPAINVSGFNNATGNFTVNTGGNLDTVEVIASAGNDRIRVAQGGSGIAVEVFANGNPSGGVKWVPIDFIGGEALVVEGGLGNDLLDLDNSNGLVILTLGTAFHGGDGDDSLLLRGSTAVQAAVYNVGPNTDEGTVLHLDGGQTQTVHFTGLEPVIDLVVAAELTVNATNADNAITYTAGPNSGITNALNPAGVNTGLVAVDGFETFEFANKGILNLEGLAGDDSFVLNNATLPAGLGTVNIDGVNGSGNDEVSVVGTPTVDDFTYIPVSSASGLLIQGGTIGLLYQLDDVDNLTLDGVSGADTLLVVADNAQVVPGDAPGSGTVNPVDAAGQAQLPLDYIHIGGSVTVLGATNVVQGTAENDTITVSNTGVVTVTNEFGFSNSVTVLGGVLVINALGGDDNISIAADAPYENVVILGGENGTASADTLNFVGAGADVTVDLDAHLISAGGPVVSFNGVENINIDAAGASFLFLGGAADDDFNVVPSAAIVELTVSSLPGVSFRTNNVADFNVNGGGGDDVLTAHYSSGPETIEVNGAAGLLSVTDPAGAFEDINFAGVDALRVFGHEGNDTFRVTPAPGLPIFIDGGDPIGTTAGDRIVIVGGDPVLFEPGPETDEGGFVFGNDPTAPERVSFDHIEAITIEAPDCVIITGTNGDDDITVIARDSSTHVGADGIRDFTVSVNNGIEILYIDVGGVGAGITGDLHIDGLAGDDDIVLRIPAPNGADFSMEIDVAGGPPSDGADNEGDRLVLETPGTNTVIFTPTGSDTGTVLMDEDGDGVFGLGDTIINIGQFFDACPPLNYDSSPGGVELFEYDGESGDDSFTVVGTDGNDTIVHTPGLADDEGTIRVNSFLGVSYQNLGLGGTLTVDGGDGTDTLVARGTDSNDAFSVATVTGAISLNSRLVLNQTGVEAATLDGLNGDDTFNVTGGHGYEQINIQGGDPSASDFLNLTGAAGVAETVVISPDNSNTTRQQITGLGGVILVSGTERIDYVGNGGDDFLRIYPGRGDHFVRVDNDPSISNSLDRVISDVLPEIHFGGVETFEISQPNLSSSASLVVTFVTSNLEGAINYQTDLENEDTLVIEGRTTFNDNYTVSVPAGANVAVTDNVSGITITDIAAFLPLGRLEINTLNGDDTVTVDVGVGGPITVPITFDGGLGRDTLLVTGTPPGPDAFDSVAYTPGPAVGQGRLQYTGPAMLIDFVSLEPVIDTTSAASLTVNGTGGDNQFTYTQGAVAANGLVAVDGFETIEFSNKGVLNLNGLGGNDNFTLNNASIPTDLTTINVDGGNPPGSDHVLVVGTPTDDDFDYTPTGFNSGTLVQSGTISMTHNLGDVEGLAVDGAGGVNNLNVAAPNAQVVPGDPPGSGTVNPVDAGGQPLLSLDYLHMSGLVTVSGTIVVVQATSENDVINVSSAGVVTITNEFGFNNTMDLSAFDVLIINALGGDDQITIAGDAPFTNITVLGGDNGDAGSDTLNFSGVGGAVTVNLQDGTVTEAGFGLVGFTGIETINLDAGGAGLTVVGTDADDDVTVTVYSATSGQLVDAISLLRLGEPPHFVTPPVINYTNITGSLLVDLAAGEDTLAVVGNALSQTFNINDSEAPVVLPNYAVATPPNTVEVDDGNDQSIDGSVTYANLESLQVAGLEGNDLFQVAPGVLPDSIPIFIDGGDPIGTTAGDTIHIFAPDGAVLPEAGPERDEGGFVIGDAQRVSYDHIEAIIITADCALVLGTNADDDITIIARDESYIVPPNPVPAGLDGVQDFTTSVNDQIPILWIDTPELHVDALAGDDDIVLRVPAPNGAVWDVDVFIAGGPPAAPTGDQGDVFEYETPGTQEIIYTPTGIDSAVIEDITNSTVITLGQFFDACPPINYDSSPGGVEEIVYQGLGGNDTLTLNGTPQDDLFVVDPNNGGSGSHTSNLAPKFTYKGATDVTVNGGAGGFDLVQVLGTAGPDTVTSDGVTVSFAGAGSLTVGTDMNRLELFTFGSADNINLDLTVAALEKYIDAGAGDDIIDLSGVTLVGATIIGGLGNDTVIGSPLADLIFGDDPAQPGGGNDVLTGLAGNDVIHGGDGNDRFGEPAARDPGANDAGNDTFFGGAGSDEFFWDPGDGDDFIEGGAGDSDQIFFFGNAGAEQFFLFADTITPSRFHLFRVQAAIDINAADVEEVNLNTLGGADTVTVGRSDTGVLSDLSTTTVKVVDISLGGDGAADNVFVEGRPLDDNLLVSVSTGIVKVAGLPYDVRLDGSDPALDRLTVRGNEGDDTIKANAGVEASILVTLDGGDGDDFLSADAILIGGNGDDLLEGGAGDDQFFGGAGEDVMFGGLGADTFDGGPDFDTILIRGTSDNDLIDVNQTAATTLVYSVGGVIETDTLVTVAGVRTVEAARVEAGAGSDHIQVTWNDALGVDATRNSLRIDVIGGPDFVQDRLNVIDSGIGDLIIHRRSTDPNAGSVEIGPGNAEGLLATYQAVERIDITPLNPITGGTGSDGAGRIVVFHQDPFEFNDSLFNAGQLARVDEFPTSPNVDPGAFGTPPFNLPGDEDWYEFRPLATNTFQVKIVFDRVLTLANGRPGLPGNGELSLEIYDAFGNLIVAGTPDADGSTAVFAASPDDPQFARIFVRVRGATPAAINVYDFHDLENEGVTDLDLVGPQITGVNIPDDPSTPQDEALYNLFQPKPTDGPTPLITALEIQLRDLPPRAPGFLYQAVELGLFNDNSDTEADSEIARGLFAVIGDYYGNAPIADVDIVLSPVVVGEIPTGTITIFFDTDGAGAFSLGLPDDRWTLVIDDGLIDPAGNALDGESNASQPLGTPSFPSGNNVAGGDFIARFTVDSRPELGTWLEGRTFIDINGNGVWDPNVNIDATNRDLSFKFGILSDHIFAGDFGPRRGSILPGFDKIGAYGKVGGVFRFLLDFNGDGIPDANIRPTRQINGIPVAGDFNKARPGDEIGVFDGTRWYLDTNGDNNIGRGDRIIVGNLRGIPIVGDFDGDGRTDLATYQPDNNRFQFDLANNGLTGAVQAVINFGFAGVRERPVAADMDHDGVTDIGLYVPAGLGGQENDAAHWYFLVSANRGSAGSVGHFNHEFTPSPLGTDLFFNFGNNFSIPVVGNFDPPVAKTVSSASVLDLGNKPTKSRATLSADVELAGNGSSAGLVARYAKGGDMYWAGLVNRGDRFFMEIRRRVRGQWRTLKSKEVGVGVGEVKLVVKGASLRAFLDGKLQLSAKDNLLKKGFNGSLRTVGTSLTDLRGK